MNLKSIFGDVSTSLGFGLAVLLGLALSVDSHAESDLIVRTRSGLVQGSASADYPDIGRFHAIPYAASTAGENRFRAPQAPPSWRGIRDAGDPDTVPACPQTFVWFFFGDEDCLVLNVFGHRNFKARKPVLVRIHGGGMVNGSAAVGAEPEASEIGAVVVTINYRLGIFGSFALPELAGEDPHRSTGNNAVRDVLAALRWVKLNIREFGGDPHDVTILGGSAGGSLVSYVAATPHSRGLFERGFALSPGLASNFLPTLTRPSEFLDSAYSRGEQTLEEAGCLDARDRLACMRALDAATVARAGQTKPLLLVTNGLFPETWPNIDGYIFTRQPAEEVGRGRNRNVTLLVGSTRDDGDLFNKRIESESEFFETFDQVFAFGLSEGTIEPEQFALARERYRPSRFGSDPQRALNAFAGDLLFNCTSLAFAESAASARRRRAPVYFYQFTHPLLSRNFEPVPDFHTVDASFWFDALSYIRFFFGIRIGPVDREMRDVMYRVFADFVHGVMPDPEFWPPLTPHDSEATDKILLENGLRSPLVSSIREGRCEFLREIGLLPDLPE